MRTAEVLIFSALASVLHLGAWAMMSDSGGAAPGDREEQAVTVTAVSEQLAALADRWEIPPELAVDVPNMTAPFAQSRPVIPVPQLARPRTHAIAQPDLPSADSVPQVLERAPDVAHTAIAPPSLPKLEMAALPAAAPAPIVQPTLRPDAKNAALQRPDTPQPPKIDAEPLSQTGELKYSKRPKAAPERPSETATDRPKGKASSAALSAQAVRPSAAKAAGTTGAAKKTPMLEAKPGTAAKLTRVWGQSITAKIQANAMRPHGNSRQIANVRLQVTVSKSGKLLGYGVARSSGFAEFDKASLRAVKRARRFAKAPAGLDKASYTFAVTVGFR